MSRLLDDWIKNYIQYTEYSESPLSYHTWAGVFCLASALQRKVYMQWGHTTIYPNQYIILVGPSGRARKGEAITTARSLIEELNIPLISDDNSPEAVILDMKRSTTNFTDAISGAVRLQSAVSCFAEELAVFTGYQNSAFLAYLTQWYDSRDKWVRRTKHQGTDEIFGVCFNLMGATAPDWIPHILTPESIGGGFTSRIMFVVEEKKKMTITNPNEKPPDKALREKLLHDLELIHTLSGEAKFDEEALSMYEKWYAQGDKDMENGKAAVDDPFFAGYNSRRATHAKKIAMALSASRSDSLVVKERDLRQAIGMMEAVEVDMSNVFGGMGTARFSSELQVVRDYIRVRGEVKRSDILRDLYRSVDDFSLEAVTKQMSGMKEVEVERLPNERDVRYKYLN